MCALAEKQKVYACIILGQPFFFSGIKFEQSLICLLEMYFNYRVYQYEALYSSIEWDENTKNRIDNIEILMMRGSINLWAMS